MSLRKALPIALALLLLAAVPAIAYENSVTYRGQGLIADGFGGYDLRTELCGVANGADVDGPYLLWVLTATKSDNADITGPWGTEEMTKMANGSFKYISGWYDPSTLPGHVTATYDGKDKNPQLVISHGCRPFTNGAWCSPGFWKNAKDSAWSLIDISKSAYFNQTVVPAFYITPSDLDPTLGDVLYHQGSANYYGAAALPYMINAYNAVGAFLTDNIPGFTFDPSKVGTSDSCPIDHFGNFK